MQHADYVAIPAVNWSTLKAMRTSALHYFHALNTVPDDADALRLGRAVHTAVFEPERLEAEYVVWTEGRRYGKAWDAFCDAATEHDKTILTPDQFAAAVRIRTAVRTSPLVEPYLTMDGGEAEKVLTWTDEKTGLPCKCRVDWMCNTGLLDLKTARNAVDTRQFASDAFRLGYFHQLEFYRRGVEKHRGQMPTLPAVIVAVEPGAPHDVAVYRLSEDALYSVGEEIDELLERVAKCRREDEWPGAFQAEQELELPRWAYPIEDMDIVEPDWTKGA